MANLSSLLKTKQEVYSDIDATGLERGKIFMFVPQVSNYFPCVCDRANGGARCHFCWWSPGKGQVVVEVWGAAGSGGKMCCCGGGVPGNPPAYSRKTFRVNDRSTICGFVGQSSENNNLCFMGCSDFSGICYFGAESEGCMCAMGGRGGWAFCSCTTAGYTPYTRFVNCCFAGSQPNGESAGCGVICNYTNYATAGFNETDWMACAWGGDVNCTGGISCIWFGHCNACCYCCRKGYLRIAANVFSECSSVLTVQHANGFVINNQSMHYVPSLFQGLAGLARNATHGSPMTYCWGTGSFCGCWEQTRCGTKLGIGVPAMSASICSTAVRDHTLRGGPGAVRIKFISD